MLVRLKLLVLLMSLFHCSSQVFAAWVGDTQAIMGTEVRIVLWHEQRSEGHQVIAAVMKEMRRIDNQFSNYKADSELSRINRKAAHQPVAVSKEMLRVLQKALFYGELTEGAFDITIASVGRYYDYRKGVSPDSQQEQQAVIDYKKVKLDELAQTVKFETPEIQIDLGGIVKGYAVDRVVGILRQRGIAHATVSAGGDSYILGDRKGRPWMVGIKNPRDGGGIALTLPLEDIAFSTSGDYERFYFDPKTGERIHHIINPTTKRSAGEVMSVSVMGPDGFDTDPLSTAIFILGIERGLALLDSLPAFDGVIIDTSGKVFYSEGLVNPE